MVMKLRKAYTHCVQALGQTDAKIVFSYLTKRSIAHCLAHPNEQTTADFDGVIRRIKSGEPLQYVLGEASFMGLSFAVDPHVLIPRQDTETLVELALDFLKNKKNAAGLDLCTGSGCIAISMQKLADVKMHAVDISEKALEVAEKNAKTHQTAVCFERADARTYCKGSGLDIIVSNPPYIRTSEIDRLDAVVKNHEPHLALDGGKTGLDFYKAITPNAKKMLKPGGMLAVEIGWDQGEAVSAIMRECFGNSEIVKDLCHLNRVVYSVKRGN